MAELLRQKRNESKSDKPKPDSGYLSGSGIADGTGGDVNRSDVTLQVSDIEEHNSKLEETITLVNNNRDKNCQLKECFNLSLQSLTLNSDMREKTKPNVSDRSSRHKQQASPGSTHSGSDGDVDTNSNTSSNDSGNTSPISDADEITTILAKDANIKVEMREKIGPKKINSSHRVARDIAELSDVTAGSGNETPY